MNTLFPEEKIWPDGFSYQSNFITIEEEQTLIDEMKHVPLHSFIFQGFEAKRRVASFGYDYSFDKKALTRGEPIPPIFHPLVEKVAQSLNVTVEEFGELLVIEYPVGAVMNWHRDAPPFDKIAGISLLSDCIFKFRPQEKLKQTRNAVISIPVQRRSMYIMDGASRTDWQHSVAPGKTVRYSITLRTLR